MQVFISLMMLFTTLRGTLGAKRQYDYSTSGESYVGPSSYGSSYTPSSSYRPSSSYGGDYPGFGNYGTLLKTSNPEFTSSYSSYGPGSEFTSTSYTNYPPVNAIQQPQIYSQRPAASSSPTNFENLYSNFLSSIKTRSPSIPSVSNEPTPISQHIEVTKPIVVPVYKKFPYAVSKRFPVAIPHPVLVPVPAPYPVNVEVSHPVPVPVIHEVRIPVEKEVLYPIETRVPITIEKPVQYVVEKHYPVYVSKPYPVKIPIVKTLIHKSPKKW